MRKVYNSRQRKIYEDYIDYSTDSLMEMLKSEKYMDEVTNVLIDILIARNVFPENYKKDLLNALSNKSEQEVSEVDRSKGLKAEQEEVNFFIKQLEHNSDKELGDIITRYTSYQLPSVEAALIIAERRGTISHREKQILFNQIENGFYEYSRKEEAITKEKIRKSSLQIQAGLLFVTIGIVLTMLTWKNPIGGYNIVFTGIISFGAVLLYKGFFTDN